MMGATVQMDFRAQSGRRASSRMPLQRVAGGSHSHHVQDPQTTIIHTATPQQLSKTMRSSCGRGREHSTCVGAAAPFWGGECLYMHMCVKRLLDFLQVSTSQHESNS